MQLNLILLQTMINNSGKILKNKPLDKSFFGEGLTIFKDQIIQLTWKSEKGLIYDKQWSNHHS